MHLYILVYKMYIIIYIQLFSADKAAVSWAVKEILSLAAAFESDQTDLSYDDWDSVTTSGSNTV